MSLPPKIDAIVRQRFSDLISEAASIVENIKRDHAEITASIKKDPNFEWDYKVHHQDTAYHALVTKVTSLIELVLGSGDRAKQLIADIRVLRGDSDAVKAILGILQGLKDDYEAGMLVSSHDIIEANVVSDYMGQAEQLLGEGIPGQYDHVPAAVLAGAVLEDSLRRLCQRQPSPIAITNTNGDPKTLDPLITDLQKASVFNKAKADMLKSWAKTRNYAAHGEFKQFNRQDVESMIAGVKIFLADYL